MAGVSYPLRDDICEAVTPGSARFADRCGFRFFGLYYLKSNAIRRSSPQIFVVRDDVGKCDVQNRDSSKLVIATSFKKRMRMVIRPDHSIDGQGILDATSDASQL